MGARYEERQIGVFDRLGRVAVMPHTLEWSEYQRYIAETGEMPDPAPPPPSPSIEEARTEKIALVENLAGDFRRRVTGRAMPSEMATWARKVGEAREVLSATGPTPFPALLVAEASARGVDVRELATRIVEKAANSDRMEALIAGSAGRHKDMLRSLKGLDSVLAYDITFGWPAMP